MARTFLRILMGLVPALLLGPGEAPALQNCKAKLIAKDGHIEVSADGVQGTVLWGWAQGDETEAFPNAGTCVAGGKARKCIPGAPGSPESITPPPLCTLYLADGVSAPCSAYIKKCTPGVREVEDLRAAICDLYDLLNQSAPAELCGPPDCGNGELDAGEQCDGAADEACPGFCQPDCTCCTDQDDDTFCVEDGDCDDTDSNVYPGATEICDGIDNNCENGVDESCDCTAGQQQPCGSDVGACVPGIQSCVAGQWGPCTGGIGPSPETCNNLDDDCDGSTDQGNPGGGAACNTGQPGVCAQGTTTCQYGVLSCVQNIYASPETCNGLDDDCDGVVDEGC